METNDPNQCANSCVKKYDSGINSEKPNGTSITPPLNTQFDSTALRMGLWHQQSEIRLYFNTQRIIIIIFKKSSERFYPPVPLMFCNLFLTRNVPLIICDLSLFSVGDFFFSLPVYLDRLRTIFWVLKDYN